MVALRRPAILAPNGAYPPYRPGNFEVLVVHDVGMGWSSVQTGSLWCSVWCVAAAMVLRGYFLLQPAETDGVSEKTARGGDAGRRERGAPSGFLHGTKLLIKLYTCWKKSKIVGISLHLEVLLTLTLVISFSGCCSIAIFCESFVVVGCLRH